MRALSERNHKRKGSLGMGESEKKGLCSEMSFTAAEAFRGLRLKIGLALPRKLKQDEGTEHYCRVIGITSAMVADGKSTIAMNLAYTYAQAGDKVLLLEGDMRRPSIGRRLGLEGKRGLSHLLTGQSYVKGCVQTCVFPGDVGFFVITAGDLPPKPAELLESEALDEVLSILSKTFDVIILDLPPVNIVVDAMVVARKIDGMLFVARRGHSTYPALREAVQQLVQSEANVLGVVYNADIG